MTPSKKKILILLVFAAFVISLIYVEIRTRSREIQYQRAIISLYSFYEEPLQEETNLPAFRFKNTTITPLATFLIRARILSREDYSFDKASKVSPIDLALGWGRMADPAVYKTLNIKQSLRFYSYSWKSSPPIPLAEIIESSANMHLIPTDKLVERALKRAKEGKFIRIKGLLVEVNDNDEWKWRSSLTRSDSGAGACEIIFVEAAAME